MTSAATVATWTLSRDRARSVMAYLEHAGVEATRMSFAGFGGTRPAVPGTTDAARARNRRVEFLITDGPGAVTPTAEPSSGHHGGHGGHSHHRH